MASIGCMSVYELTEENREQAIEELKEFQVAYLKQPDIMYFFFSFDLLEPNYLIINDGWTSLSAFQKHMRTDEVANQWPEFVERYIVRTVREEVYEWEHQNDVLLP